MSFSVGFNCERIRRSCPRRSCPSGPLGLRPRGSRVESRGEKDPRVGSRESEAEAESRKPRQSILFHLSKNILSLLTIILKDLSQI